MKTITQAEKDSGVSAKLIRGVIKQLGGMDIAKESMRDIVNHGIDGGFSGFIYYNDTIAFFKKFRSEIRELVCDQAEEFGVSPIDFVASFNCLKYDNDIEGKKEIRRALFGKMISDDCLVPNALSWYAGEEVSRLFFD